MDLKQLQNHHPFNSSDWLRMLIMLPQSLKKTLFSRMYNYLSSIDSKRMNVDLKHGIMFSCISSIGTYFIQTAILNLIKATQNASFAMIEIKEY